MKGNIVPQKWTTINVLQNKIVTEDLVPCYNCVKDIQGYITEQISIVGR